MDVLLTGANGQARALAVAAARAGHAPIMYDPEAQPGNVSLAFGGTWGEGTVEARVTNDIATAQHTPLIAISDDLHAREPQIAAITPHLTQRHIVLLNPGGFGGGPMLAARLRDGRGEAAVAELAGFPLLTDDDGVTIQLRAMKHDLPIAVHPAQRADEVCAQLRTLLPTIAPTRSALEVGLTNTNHFIHPPLVLLNAIRIDRAERFRFYREGLSAAAMRLVHDIDRERLALGARLNVALESLESRFDRFYAPEGMRGTRLFDQLSSFEPFGSAEAPRTLRHRYVLDDVAFGLAPIARVSERLGVAAPRMRATIDALCSICGRDFWSDGASVEVLRAGDATLAALLGGATNGGATVKP